MFKRSSGTLGRVESPATRKKQKTANGDAVQDEGRELLKAVDKLEDRRTQRSIAAEFQRLPSKKTYPDYYKLIKKPIALDVIQDNLDDGEYVTLELLREDLLQMCNNAKRYNQKGSMLYGDAAEIARLVKGWSDDAAKYSDDSDLEDVSKELSARNYRTMLNQTIKGIMRDLKEAKDRNGRRYVDIFLELPDRKLYPDYYTMIPNPMSVTSLEIRMKKNPYTKIDKFHEHIDQLWQNAFTYNDPKSYVAQDARHLQKLVSRLIDEARPRIEAQEKELIEQAKLQAKLEARMPKAEPKADQTGGTFKIKLGLRQPSATPSQTPLPKVKLNIGGGRYPGSSARESPVATPALRKSATPVPAPTVAATAVPTPAIMEKSQSVAGIATSTNTPDQTPIKSLAPANPPPAINALEAPILYSNPGTPLVQFLSLCASQILPPLILHIPAVPGQASLVYSWTLPMAASAMTVSPSLCSSLLEGKRGYSLSLSLNGRKVSASRQANGQSALKNSIWDLKLSAGMNCIECIVEGEELSSVSPPAVEAAEAKMDGTEAKAASAEALPRIQGKARERLVILAFLR